MIAQCRHTEPGDLPEFLCRQCHPELILTREARDAADATERAAHAARTARESLLRELEN